VAILNNRYPLKAKSDYVFLFLYMKLIKPRNMTKEEVQAIQNSPTVIRKKKEAQELFHSPEFESHIQKKSAQRKKSLITSSVLKRKVVVKKNAVLSQKSRNQVA
jgi:hypothetical protein